MIKLFTPKQREVLQAYASGKYKTIILSGAVRSGKTYIDNYLFLMELKRVQRQAKANHDQHPQYILAGYSSGTIYSNVISAIGTQFGIDMRTDRHGHYNLFGVDIVPAYTGNKRGESAIRGMTSYGAYINEASTSDKDTFVEITNRCSMENAVVICDTNPDSPQHWLKEQYIDNENANARIKTFMFTIDDNPTLDAEFVRSLKASVPVGVMYDRRIRGLWVSGEGIVYKEFDKDKMCVDELPNGDLDYTCGVDWGYKHPTSIVVFATDSKGVHYLVEEHTCKEKQIEYWVTVAKDIQERYGKNIPFYCDTARVEHIEMFQSQQINAQYGYKNVMDGIERVSNMLHNGKLLVLKRAVDNTGVAPDSENYSHFLDEIYQYVWDDKKDAVVKDHDHVMDAMRYCLATPDREAEQARENIHTSLNDIRSGLERFGY